MSGRAGSDAQGYFRASLSRLVESDALYRRNRSTTPRSLDVPGMYAAGVSVEFLFRAFILRRAERQGNPPHFDARHDLVKLLRESRIWRIEHRPKARSPSEADVDRLKQFLEFEVDLAHRLWRNSYRFYSHDDLKASLHERGLDRGMRGDAVKECFRRLLASAHSIVNRGELQWRAW